MIQLARDALALAGEISGANVLTIVILIMFVGGYFIFKLSKQQRLFAKKCGIQKQLLVGHVQMADKLSPSDALIKTNKMTKDAMD